MLHSSSSFFTIPTSWEWWLTGSNAPKRLFGIQSERHILCWLIWWLLVAFYTTVSGLDQVEKSEWVDAKWRSGQQHEWARSEEIVAVWQWREERSQGKEEGEVGSFLFSTAWPHYPFNWSSCLILFTIWSTILSCTVINCLALYSLSCESKLQSAV